MQTQQNLFGGRIGLEREAGDLNRPGEGLSVENLKKILQTAFCFSSLTYSKLGDKLVEEKIHYNRLKVNFFLFFFLF